MAQATVYQISNVTPSEIEKQQNQILNQQMQGMNLDLKISFVARRSLTMQKIPMKVQTKPQESIWQQHYSDIKTSDHTVDQINNETGEKSSEEDSSSSSSFEMSFMKSATIYKESDFNKLEM